MEGGELVVDHGGARVAPKLGRVLVEQRGDARGARRLRVRARVAAARAPSRCGVEIESR